MFGQASTTRNAGKNPSRGKGSRGGFALNARGACAGAFTLVEVLLVISLIGLLMYFVVPVFTGELERRRLTDSVDRMRNMVALTRAHAMNDGKRYRIRWEDQDMYDEAEENNTTLQPIIEVEDKPIEEPANFTPVKDLWSQAEVLHEGIQCVEVRLGKPKTPEQELREREQEERYDELASRVDDMFEEDDKLEDMFEDMDVDEAGTEEEKDPVRPAIVFEPDGTVEWATIFLTNGEETDEGELQTWEILIDARTGKIGWRRTLTEAEYEEQLAEREEIQEERKIVRGREAGAR